MATSQGGARALSKPTDKTTARPGRRRFLGSLFWGSCAVSVGAFSWLGYRLVTSLGGARRKPPQSLGAVQQFASNTRTLSADGAMMIVRQDDCLGVMSQRCTHLGCLVIAEEQGYRCPCHGARYNLAGEVLAGPATAPLPWLTTWVEEGELWVVDELDGGGCGGQDG